MLSLQSYTESAFDEWHVNLLHDVAAHVSLALANADHFAQAQTERARLEALHLLDMGVASASEERQLAEAVFGVVCDYLGSTHMVLAYVDVGGMVAGFTGQRDERASPMARPTWKDRSAATCSATRRATSYGRRSRKTIGSWPAWSRCAMTEDASRPPTSSCSRPRCRWSASPCERCGCTTPTSSPLPSRCASRSLPRWPATS